MRYYIRCKLNPGAKNRLADSIKSGSLARGNVFYEGMQTALREGTIDENDIVHFVEVCYCLERDKNVLTKTRRSMRIMLHHYKEH
jgi:hypothetical protein